MTSLIRTPFRQVNECIEAINSLDINKVSEMIRDRFIRFLSRQYVRVHELNGPLEVKDDFIVLADTRGVLLFAYICGADYELERTYKLEISPNRKPIYVNFESWIPMHCAIHCHMNTNTLTLMPMTAVIIRFPESVRVRVEPLFV